MSASLVGSEMCIRDSSSSAWHPLETVHVGAPPASRLLKAPLYRPSLAPPCLLYTSDAADDM
eukprot:13380172-Alexandrium_andersonii.AAC.1